MNPAFEYTVHGPQTGPWVTLSHPIGASQAIWAGQIEALAPKHRVLVYDIRGHGQDQGRETTCSVDDLAHDVLRLWDQLGIRRSHFVGLSLGGCIGVALAHGAPDRVQSLVVANSRLEMDATATAMWEQRATLVEQQGMAPVVAPTLERWLTPEFMAAQPAAVDQVRQTLLATPAQGFAACARALANMHQQQRLSGLQVPTLLISGLSDQAVSSAMVEQYARQNPTFGFVALPGPHILNLENPVGFNQTVLDFIDRH
jgi:3-oxoadipate enol-lactonase